MTIFIDLCNDYPEAFKTLLDCSLRKKILPRVFSRLAEIRNLLKTAVEIENIIETHNTKKIIIRFCVLMLVNLCSRASFCTCKFVNEFVTFLMWYRRKSAQFSETLQVEP